MYNIFEQSLTPYFAFNTMLAKATQSAITQHLTNVEEFTKIGLENFYSGMNARTLDDVVAFSKRQPEIMQRASALLMKRSEGYTDLSKQFYKSSQELFADNLKNAAVNAKYDLGESIVIKKPKKKSAAKPTKSSTQKKKASTPVKAKTPAKKKPLASTKAKKPVETSVKKKPLASTKAKKPVETSVKKKPVEKKAVAKTKIKPSTPSKQSISPSPVKTPVKEAVNTSEKGSSPSKKA